MSCRLVINVGQSFAELMSNSGLIPPTRWHLSKKSLKDGLVAALQGFDPQESLEILLVFAPGQHLPRGHFHPPAFIVTSGFESWLARNSAALKITAPPQSLTFGVSERISATGATLKKLELSELEFLVTKLKMLSVDSLAVGFLHSQKHPENEKLATSYFKENGFLVSPSYIYSGPEDLRWSKAVTNAAHAGVEKELLKEIQSALEAAGVTKAKAQVPLTPGFAVEGLPQLVNKSLKQKGGEVAIVHWGLEHFSSFHQNQTQHFPIDLSRALETGFWLAPGFASQGRHFDDTSICLGRSLQPSLLDILSLEHDITHIEGLQAFTPERFRARIIESLFTLGKSNPERRNISGELYSRELLECALRIAESKMLEQNTSGSFLFTGPFAPIFFQLFRERSHEPEKYMLAQNYKWYLNQVILENWAEITT